MPYELYYGNTNQGRGAWCASRSRRRAPNTST